MFSSSEVLLNKSCSLVLFSKSCSSLYRPSVVSLLADAGVAACDSDDGLCDPAAAHATPLSASKKNSSSSILSKRGVAAVFARLISRKR